MLWHFLIILCGLYINHCLYIFAIFSNLKIASCGQYDSFIFLLLQEASIERGGTVREGAALEG